MFEPLVPPPRAHRVTDHGVLAPGGPPPGLRGEFEAAFSSRWREVLTIRTKRWRYVWNLQFGEIEKRLIEEHKFRARFSDFQNEDLLYDLESDPRATRNLLSGPQPGEAAERTRDGLRKELVRWLNGRAEYSGAQPLIDDELLYKELMELGDVEFVPERCR